MVFNGGQHLYEGSVYSKSNLYLANNNMATDYLNKKELLMQNVFIVATCGIPDPELALKFGDVQMIMGFLPWQTRLTEFQ